MKLLGLTIPQKVRFDFSQPRGKLVYGELSQYIDSYNWKKVACVGDVVTYYCFKANRKPDIIIIDGKTLRNKEVFSLNSELINQYTFINVKNPAGILIYDNLDNLCKILNDSKKTIIYVNGEEDILALPILSCAPDNSLIIYGIPNKGAALVHMSKFIRRELQNKILSLKPDLILD